MVRPHIMVGSLQPGASRSAFAPGPPFAIRSRGSTFDVITYSAQSLAGPLGWDGCEGSRLSILFASLAERRMLPMVFLLQETRWRTSGTRQVGDYTCHSVGTDTDPTARGLMLCVHKDWSTMLAQPLSARLCKLVVRRGCTLFHTIASRICSLNS